MTRKDKLQYLLITHLLENGSIEIELPDHVRLQIGITQEDKYGNIIKSDDYCWVTTSREGKGSTLLDSYNLGLQFNEDDRTILLDDQENGVRTLSVI